MPSSTETSSASKRTHSSPTEIYRMYCFTCLPNGTSANVISQADEVQWEEQVVRKCFTGLLMKCIPLSLILQLCAPPQLRRRIANTEKFLFCVKPSDRMDFNAQTMSTQTKSYSPIPYLTEHNCDASAEPRIDLLGMR